MQTKKEKMEEIICNSKINSKFVRQAKGITLIALVITIIIILILSTVTITTVVGDDGIIKQAQMTQQTAENSLQSETGRMNTILSEYTNIMGFDGTVAGPDEPGTDPDLPGGTNTTDPGGNTIDPGGDDDKPVSGDSVVNKLKEGDWVYYVDKNNTYRRCRVLYGPENENYESFGLQIITMTTAEVKSIGKSVSATTNNIDTMLQAISQYNTVIDTFNTTASTYYNDTYAQYVRCVGSIPNLPSYDAAGLRINAHVTHYNGKLKDIDNNYLTDYNQMLELQLNDIDTVYWLASRYANEEYQKNYDSEKSTYISDNYIRTIDANGELSNARLFRFYTNLSYYSHKSYIKSYGIRLVIRLKPEVKVVGGQGNETDPYQLGV